MVAEDRRFITVACSNFSPEPTKEEHARHGADKEDGLKTEVLGLSLSLRVQPVRRRGSRSPRRPSPDHSLSTCVLALIRWDQVCKALVVEGRSGLI